MAYEACERETIITTSDFDGEWVVFTRQQKYIKKLIKLGYEPQKVEMEGDKIVSCEFTISLSKISFRKAIVKERVMTDEQRQAARERLLANVNKQM